MPPPRARLASAFLLLLCAALDRAMTAAMTPAMTAAMTAALVAVGTATSASLPPPPPPTTALPSDAPGAVAGRRLRILVAPFPGGPSHAMVVGRLAGELGARGHAHVTLLLPAVVSKFLAAVAPASTAVTHVPYDAPIAVAELTKLIGRMQLTGSRRPGWRGRVGPMGHMASFQAALGKACADVVRNETMVSLLRAADFDLVVGDRMDSCGPAIASALSVGRPVRLPLVNLHVGSATDPWLDDDGVLYPPSSVSSMNLAVWGGPGAASGHPRPPGSLAWRLRNAGSLLLNRALLHCEVNPGGAAARAALGWPDPPDKSGRPVLTLINSDWAIDWPRAVPPSVVLVGGMMAGPAKPLEDKALAAWLATKKDGAGVERPTLYAATGSFFAHTPEYADALVAGLLSTGVRLLIKLTDKEMSDDAVAALPHDRVRVLRWAPQNDLLPLTDLFLSHGGASSTYEALSHGIPLIVAPSGAEQPANAARVAAAGAGLALPMRPPVAAVVDAVSAALADLPALRAGARAAQLRLKAGRRPAAAVAAEAVEHVAALAAAGVDPGYLRPSAALDAPWIVRTGVDVAGVVLGGITVAGFIGAALVRRVVGLVKAKRGGGGRVSASRKQR